MVTSAIFVIGISAKWLKVNRFIIDVLIVLEEVLMYAKIALILQSLIYEDF